jgi:hypothetical protein
MIGYKYHPDALEELEESAAFYDFASDGLGFDLLAEVEKLIFHLRTFPQSGSKVDENLRSVVVRRFPFKLIYSYEITSIVILAVAHDSRRPGYWRDRV